MSNTIYGLEGKTGVFGFVGTNVPEDMIEMVGERPAPWYVAQADGTWAEDLDEKARLEAIWAAN